MPAVTIHLNGASRVLDTQSGTLLLPLLREAGYTLPPAPCGGKGRCGNCLVTVEAAGKPERVPACRTKIETDLSVYLAEEDASICATGSVGTFPPDRNLRGVGAAVDIGTTTVVLYLADLETGEILSVKSGQNQQRAFGADVISRIQHCAETPDGLAQLTDAIRRQISAFLTEACAEAGRRAEEVSMLSIAGNTVMEHIFAALSPKTIATAPFTPLSLFGETMEAGRFSLPIDPKCPVYLAPCAAGYVGGDITAGLLASGAYLDKELCFFLDIGTNGEMALGENGSFLSCATAAGPAFEGAEITCGMAGVAGAVSRVWAEADGTVRFEVIGGEAPKGICGSGLVDLLAVLLDLGLVDETGRLLPKDEAPEAYQARLEEIGGGVRFYLNDAVYITDGDIRKLQLAKAAVAAGIQTLLTRSNRREDEIKTVYLAGGFGNYMDKNSAARIGLIPRSFADKLQSVGNSAGMGALAVLLSARAQRDLEVLWKQCDYHELSGSAVFNEAFIACMTFDDLL